MAMAEQKTERHVEEPRRLLVLPEEAAVMLAVSRSTVYVLMASGDLPSVKIGKSRRLRIEDVEAYVERLADPAVSGIRREA